MTKEIISVDKDENLKHVMNLMEKNDITKLPVLEDKKLIGMVTDNIIAYKLGSIRKKGVPPSKLYASSMTDKNVECIEPDTDIKTILKKVGKKGPTMLCVTENKDLKGIITKADILHLVESKKQIKDFMRTDIFTVSSEDRVIHARRIMIDENIARIPVVDEGKLVGIISDNEIAFSLAELKRQYPVGKQKHRLDELLVKDAMKSPVIFIGPNKTAKDAADVMIEENVGALPVIQNDKLVGIISRTDLLNTIPR
jgi:CBS domain-containing protein